MITNTFIHLPGVGETTEQRLWEQGIRSWDDLEASLETSFSAKKAQKLAIAIEESRSALEAGEFRYFQERLKSAHAWRLLPHCLENAESDSIAYLDIETTGLGFPPMAHSTTIAVMFNGELFVEHEPSKKRELMERVEREAKVIVTFNGASFDLPFLRKELGLELPNAHVDLCVWFRRHDVRGGLKAIQLSYPEVHQRSSMDIDGFDAVRLWRMHKRGVPRALETLMTYNAEDTVCLAPLLRIAYERVLQTYAPSGFLRELPVSTKPLPQIQTEVCSYVYQLLRGEESWNVPEGW